MSDSSPPFIPFQFCKLVKAPPEGARWIHEVKFDGYRMQLRIHGDEITWRTRNLHDWSRQLAALTRVLPALPDGILDGELCAIGEGGLPDFSMLRSAIGRGDAVDLVFFAFDCPWLVGEDLRGHPLELRKRLLAQALGGVGPCPQLRFVDRVPGTGRDLLYSACQMGLEGIVSKRLDAPYRAGKDGAWTKAKCRPQVEVVIGGWEASGPSLGRLLAGVYRGGLLTYVGGIGTGFDDQTLRELRPKLAAAEVDRSPFEVESPKRNAAIHWTRPELVANVEMAEWTSGGKLRQASFKGLREDKDPQEVTDERES